MNVLYYNPGRSTMGKKLLAVMKLQRLADHIVVYRTIEAFSERLRQPAMDKAIAIVLAPTERDLLDIYFIKYLFYKMPIVLLLPDRQKDTIAVGRRCGSRSILYLDADFSEITETLRALGRGPDFRQQLDDCEEQQYEAA